MTKMFQLAVICLVSNFNIDLAKIHWLFRVIKHQMKIFLEFKIFDLQNVKGY